MSIVELVLVKDDETDAEIVRLCEDGVSVARVAKQFGLSQHEMNAALDRALFKIDGPYKRQQIALSALRLDELTEVFHKQAKAGDIGAEGSCCRAGARIAATQKKHDRGWGRPNMRLPASEKLELIHLVEQSHLPVRRTLEMLGIRPSTFYRWYDRFKSGGPEALEDRPSKPDRVWNRIPDEVRQRVVAMALDQPELSPLQSFFPSWGRQPLRRRA
jgi:transposase-like protein